MSEQNKSDQPFSSLGEYLKKARSKRRESLLEVSGAVEIDADKLSDYEQGKDRPSEDILMLLISYFGVKEDEASKVWQLAGYGTFGSVGDSASVDEIGSSVMQVMVMPMDARIVYTDMVHVMVNNHGVVINFMQGAGINNQPLAVSRIGMSKEHAYSLLDVLKKTLEQADKPKTIKQLPANTKSDRKTDKPNRGKE